MRHKIGGIHQFKCQACGYSGDQYVNYHNDDQEILCPKCRCPLVMIVLTPESKPPNLIGLEWDTATKGYRSRIVQEDVPDDPVGEIRYDLRKLEESMHEAGNLKEYYMKKRALRNFEIAHKDILE